MTRRIFLAAITAAPLLEAEASPRNQLCESANEFHQPYSLWADKMNAAQSNPYTVPADAIEAFQPLPQLWRKVERKFRTWVTGR